SGRVEENPAVPLVKLFRQPAQRLGVVLARARPVLVALLVPGNTHRSPGALLIFSGCHRFFLAFSGRTLDRTRPRRFLNLHLYPITPLARLHLDLAMARLVTNPEHGPPPWVRACPRRKAAAHRAATTRRPATFLRAAWRRTDARPG